MARPHLLLALETATRAVSVALLRGEELWAEVIAPDERPAAESLLPAIGAALERAGIGLEAVEALAVSIGPGSFTSLRIGLATAKGLVLGRPCPVVPVPTLAALALSAGAPGEIVVPLLDARRGEVYAAGYRLAAAGPGEIVAEGVYTAEALASRLPARCLLAGEGVAVVGDALRRRLGPGLRSAPEARPSARSVGVLGARGLARGLAADAGSLVPRYLRRAQAEVVRTGERFESASETP